MPWQRYIADAGGWVYIPDEFAGEGDRYVPDATTPEVFTVATVDTPVYAPPAPVAAAPIYSGAGAYSSYFSKPNDFGNTKFYGVPGSVGLMLRDAANAVGLPNYDFNLAAYMAAPGYGWALPGATGWLLGANEEMIYRNIMINTGIPEFIDFAALRSQAAYDAGAAAGFARDVELAKQNAQSKGIMGDLLTIAAIAGAIYGAYALYSFASTGFATAAAATAPMDAGAFLAAETAGAGVSASEAASLLSLSSTIPQTAGQIAQAMQSIPTSPFTPDMATASGDIGGAAFPTDAATVAGQWNTVPALTSMSLPSVSQIANTVKAAAPLVKTGAGLIAALMTGTSAPTASGVRHVTLAPGQTEPVDTGGIFGQGGGIGLPLLIAGIAALALKG